MSRNIARALFPAQPTLAPKAGREPISHVAAHLWLFSDPNQMQLPEPTRGKTHSPKSAQSDCPQPELALSVLWGHRPLSCATEVEPVSIGSRGAPRAECEL